MNSTRRRWRRGLSLVCVVLAVHGVAWGQNEEGGEAGVTHPVDELWEEFTLPDREVGRAVRQGLPLTPEQIAKILALLSQYRETVARESRPAPEIVSREITVSLVAGESAPVVSTQMGYPTSVVFIDATGEPWPVDSLVVEEAFGPTEGAPGGHVVYVTPVERFLHGSALVQLAALSMPIVLELEPGTGRVDGRLVVRVAQAGPNADPIVVERTEDFGPGDPVISAFLHGHAPAEAQRIEVRGGNVRDRAWWLQDAIYLRTAKTLLAPQAQASERGANGETVYRIADTPYALVSVDGARVRLTFGRKGRVMAGEEREPGGTEALQVVQTPEATASESPPPTPEVPGPSLGERARHGIRANRWAGVVLIALGLAVGGWWWAQQEELLVAPSRLGTGSTVTANPLEGTSEAYEEALDEGEEVRRTEAVESGQSFVEAMQSGQSLLEEQGAQPVLPERLPPSAAPNETADEPPEEDDALVRRDYPEPEPREPVVLRSETPAPAPAVAIDAMLEELIAAWSAAPQMTVIRYGEEEPAEEGTDSQAAAGTSAVQGAGDGETETVLVPAGRMVYAATKVGVDSELALPVLVEVLERPFVGALLRGEFQQVRDRMLVRFTRLSDERKGLDVAVNAYAVGLECECGAVDGEVDRHWVSRVILPAAFGFAQEYLAAAAQPQVTVSVDGQVVSQQYESGGRERVARGLAGALGQTGDVVFESLPRRATVRLPRGTEFAVVFVDPVKVEAG